MKTQMTRAFVVVFALAAFGFLAISPSRAQSTTGASGGCCGSTSTGNTSSSH